MTEHRGVIAIILARGGSKGLPGKNIKPLAGKPLIAYSIEACQKSGVCDDIFVSTDTEEIAEVARAHGAWVPFLRPPELATDFTLNEPVLQHVLEEVETRFGVTYDIGLHLQPTDLFRSPSWIRQSVETLRARPELETVFVATESKKNFWLRDDKTDEWVRVLPEMKTYMSRQRPTRRMLYREDTGLACASRVAVFKAGFRTGDRVELIVQDDFRAAIDIHTEFDHWLAEQVIARWGLPE